MAMAAPAARWGRARTLALAALFGVVAALAGCGSPERPGQDSAATSSTTCVQADGNVCGSEPPSELGPAGCGLEVLECPGAASTNPGPGPAECTTESYRLAVLADIDGGSFQISGERCDGTWATFVVDRSRDACPASEEPQPGCPPGTRAHRTFWHAVEGQWRIITYGGAGDCAEVHAVEPAFPPELCA
jgi:hypothetical protein